MTQAARKIAGGSHSLLALLLCVIVLAAAVDSNSAANDPLFRDRMLAWTDGDGDDDLDGPHSLTAYAYAALCGGLSTVPSPSHSDFGISLPGRPSEGKHACVRPRGPPRSRELSEASSYPGLIVSRARFPIS